MKKTGLPHDWKTVSSLKRMGKRSGPVKWQMLKAAVAWRVMSRFFKNKSNKAKIVWRSDLKRLQENYDYSRTGFVNEIVADNMADQILMLGGFEDERIRRKLGKDTDGD
jgi:hypothetical protein